MSALQLIERERCTVWNAVDAMVTAMLEHPDLDRYDRSSLRTGGPCRPGEEGELQFRGERVPRGGRLRAGWLVQLGRPRRAG